MKIHGLVLLVVLACLITSSPAADADGLSSANDILSAPLEKRACKENGRLCLSGLKEGVYCGNCYQPSTGYWVIQKKGVGNHAFQCNINGDCCDFGFAKDCGLKNAHCKGLKTWI